MVEGSEATSPSPRRLRVLHVIASVDPSGGGPIEGVKRHGEAMRDRVQQEVVSLDRPDAPHVLDFPVKVYALGVASGVSAGSDTLRRFGYTPRLVPWLKANAGRYDAVIVNGIWNYASVAGARALPGAGVPYYVFTHGMLDPWFRKIKPVKHLVKQLSWLAFEGRLLHGARAVLFTCQEERLRAEGQFFGYRYNAEVVRYGAPDVGGNTAVQVATFRQACPALGANPYLLFLSRIHPKKGCDLLIRAFAEIAPNEPNLHLVMAGPCQDGWSTKLREEAARLGVQDRIHWPGMLSGDAKWGAFRGAQVFVLPSHQENFGIAVAESLACATPVLITDKVNIWREVEAAGAGLVAGDDQSGVTSLLSRWISEPLEARRRRRDAARACFEAHFDVRTAAHELADRIAAVAEGSTLAR